MDTTWIDVGGLIIRAPVTAGTNLLLAVQCSLYFRALRTAPSQRSRLWAGFFLAMAVATLAGVVKHGFRHELAPSSLLLVLWVSNLGAGLSTYFAQCATLDRLARVKPLRKGDSIVRAQLLLFLAANVAFGPEILVLLANTAVGLLPVIGAEARAAHRGQADGAWIAAGLSLSIGTGVVYVAELSAGPWLNHVDIAHLLLGVSFWMMLRGARPEAAPSEEPQRAWRAVPPVTTHSGSLR